MSALWAHSGVPSDAAPPVAVRGCRYQVSLAAGTILHNTKTPLTAWFWATYLTVTDKRGMSALLLQRQLGLKRSRQLKRRKAGIVLVAVEKRGETARTVARP